MSNKKRILFVDDEPNVLDGLRRMLHSMRHEWDMLFVQSGQEALDAMAKEFFDVIVTDMRMPGMNGTELLNEVVERYPQTIRIVLSAQADEEAFLRAVGPTQQFLSKPCDPEILKSTVNRSCALRDLLADDDLKRLISQMKNLPRLPTVYHELVRELQSPDASIKAVGEIISQDVGMTAEILRLVNSAFFGFSRRISDPVRAAVLLGIEMVKALVLSAHVFAQFEQILLAGLSLEVIRDHSMAVGAFAQRIAKVESDEQSLVGDAFVAGLLHDVGKLVLAAELPEQYGSVLSVAAKEKIWLPEAERQELGATHGEVGAYLMGLWGLGDTIIEALAFHHNPTKSLVKEFTPLTAIHIADFLEHEVYPRGKMSVMPEIDHEYLSELGLSEQLPVWREICQETIEEGNDQ